MTERDSGAVECERFGDPKMTTALLDCLTHHADIVKTGSECRCLRNAPEPQSTASVRRDRIRGGCATPTSSAAADATVVRVSKSGCLFGVDLGSRLGANLTCTLSEIPWIDIGIRAVRCEKRYGSRSYFREYVR